MNIEKQGGSMQKETRRFVSGLFSIGFIWFLIPYFLTAESVSVNTYPEIFTVRMDNIPDMMQTDPAANLPENGISYCAPVSVSNSLMWLADQGFVNLRPKLENRKKAQARLTQILGSSKYMKTGRKGTSVFRLMRGVSRYVKDCGYEYKRLECQGWRKSYPSSQNTIKVPDIGWIKKGLVGLSGVWLNIGWYTYDPIKDEYHRFGGHWVTCVGYGIDPLGQKSADTLIIHDPSPRSGIRKTNEFIKLTRLYSGTLTGRHYEGIPRSADGFFDVTGTLKVRNSADIAILDAVVVLEM